MLERRKGRLSSARVCWWACIQLRRKVDRPPSSTASDGRNGYKREVESSSRAIRQYLGHEDGNCPALPRPVLSRASLSTRHQCNLPLIPFLHTTHPASSDPSASLITPLLPHRETRLRRYPLVDQRTRLTNTLFHLQPHGRDDEARSIHLSRTSRGRPTGVEATKGGDHREDGRHRRQQGGGGVRGAERS